MPCTNAFAVAFALNVTATVAPGDSAPPVADALSHTHVLARDHCSGAVPIFVSANVVGGNGPPVGPWIVQPNFGRIERSSKGSNDSTTPKVVLLAGDSALTPIPRLANAAQSSLKLAPALLTRSACR